MSEMVERVGTAMEAVRYLTVAAEMNPQLLARLAETPEEEWSAVRIEHGLAVKREWYLRMARAGVAIMREPTEAMVRAFNEYPGQDGEASWQAMVEEALR